MVYRQLKISDTLFYYKLFYSQSNCQVVPSISLFLSLLRGVHRDSDNLHDNFIHEGNKPNFANLTYYLQSIYFSIVIKLSKNNLK